MEHAPKRTGCNNNQLPNPFKVNTVKPDNSIKVLKETDSDGKLLFEIKVKDGS